MGHGFFRRIHKGRFHGFKPQRHAVSRGYGHGVLQILRKARGGIGRGGLVIHVIPRQLDQPYPQIAGKPDGLF